LFWNFIIRNACSALKPSISSKASDNQEFSKQVCKLRAGRDTTVQLYANLLLAVVAVGVAAATVAVVDEARRRHVELSWKIVWDTRSLQNNMKSNVLNSKFQNTA
jgi:hypothetical protein